MTDKNIVKGITVNAETVEGLLKLHYQLQRHFDYKVAHDGNGNTTTEVVRGELLAVEKVLDLIGIDYYDADFCVVDGHWYV